jgi:polyisoprenoid-binding protein YceI
MTATLKNCFHIATTASLLVSGLLVLGVAAYAAGPWALQPKGSSVSFIAKQAGAEFTGNFEKFNADIKFDPSNLATSRFDVKIEMASVNSQDQERDDTLKSSDLFDVKKFPAAKYVADKFTDKGNGKYTGAGKLTLRDKTRDVPIDFTFKPSATGGTLQGTAALKRNDFGVGQGEWADTSSVANEVKVRFTLLLKK